VDPQYAHQLMSESMPDEDLPSTSLRRAQQDAAEGEAAS